MARARKSFARYGPVILAATAAAYSAYAPLRGTARAATPPPRSFKTEAKTDEKVGRRDALFPDLSADPIPGMPGSAGDLQIQPLETHLNKSKIATPLPLLSEPLPDPSISLLNTSSPPAPGSRTTLICHYRRSTPKQNPFKLIWAVGRLSQEIRKSPTPGPSMVPAAGSVQSPNRS